MNKNILLAVVLVLIGRITVAQSFNVNFYPERRSIDPKVIRYGNSYYFFEMDMQGMSGFSANLKRFMHNIRLKKYNDFMEEELQLLVNAPDKSFGPIPPALKLFHNKLYLLYFKPGEKDKISLWAAPVDTATLEISAGKEIMQIDEDDRIIQYNLRSVDHHSPDWLISRSNAPQQLYKSFFTGSSADGSKSFVAWTSGWSKKLFLSVLDKDMNKIRTKTEEIPDENTTALSNASIDNNGNVYISWFYTKKNTGHAELLVNKTSGSEIRSIEIPGGEAAGICSELDQSRGRLLVSGPYKEGSDNLLGAYIQSFTIDGMKAGALNKTVFPDDLVSVFDKEGWANDKDKKKGLYDAMAFQSRLLDNGTMNLTGEFRRRTEGVRAVFDLAGSILNVRFDNTNSTAVFSRVPKIRVSAGSTIGDSYAVFDYKNKIYIFYDDHMVNLNLDMSATPKRSDEYNNSVLAAAIIDEKGIVNREVVKDLSKEDYLGVTSSMHPVKPGSYFIPFLKIKRGGGIGDDIKWALIDVK